MSINIYDFVQNIETRVYKGGDSVFREGDNANYSMYFLLTGELHVYKNYEEDATLIHKLKEGDFFGELGLIANQRRTATVIVASRTSKVGILQKNVFLKLARINPLFVFKFLKMTIERLIITEKNYIKLMNELNEKIISKSNE